METNSEQQGCGQKVLIIFVIAFAAIVMLAGAVLVLGAPLAAWVGFQSLSKEVQVAVGAAVITVTGSVASLIITNQVNRQKELEQQLRRKKEPIYEELLEFCFKLNNQVVPDEEVEQFLNTFSQKLLLWGSDGVVSSFVNTRKTIGENKGPKDVMLSFEKMFRAIRSDFGHKNKNIQEGDLSSFLITRKETSSDKNELNDKKVLSIPTSEES